MIECPREIASLSFAAWLQVVAFTGLRPGELDASRRANFDLTRGRILVVEQFNAKTRTFTLPKNGLTRLAPLTDPARDAILNLPLEGEFCFGPIIGRRALGLTIGRRSEAPQDGRGASISRRSTLPAGT